MSKSISLSDLIDLHIRLSKQDGVERPDPLYIVLSTQARFTKRYSELLTAAGEGKGLSQVCTFNPTNGLSAANDLPQPPGSPILATKDSSTQDNNEPKENDLPVTASEREDRNANPQAADEVSPSQQPQAEAPSEGRESIEIAVDSQEPVEVVAQEYEEAGQPPTEEESGDEEELLPAEEEEEQSNNNAISAHLHTKFPQEEVTEKRPNEISPIKNINPMTRAVNEIGAGVTEEAGPETTQLEEEHEPEKEQNFEEGTGEQAEAEAKVEEEELEQEVINGGDSLEAKEGFEELESYEQNSQRANGVKTPGQEESSTKVGAPSEDTRGDFAAEEEGQYQRVQDAPVVVDTVYNTRSFATEELLDYEEEEGQSSPFSEIPDEAGQTGEEGHGFTHDTNDEEDAEHSPATASHETEITGHPDEDSFSSATVVGAGDVHSPVPHSLSHSGTRESQSPPEIGTEQHHIQVYQYEEEAPVDFNDAEQEGEEVGGLGVYAVQGVYEYHEGPWGGDESGDYLQEESYYTAVVDQEEYDPGQYEENPNTVLIQDGDTGEGSTGDLYEEDGEGNIDYLDEEEYNDEGAYNEYSEDAEEVTEHDVSRGAKSPIAKRHREEETDVLDIQGKRGISLHQISSVLTFR